MSAFQQILIGLDLSSLDKQLLEHLPLYAGGQPTPKLHFVHVCYEFQLPILVGNRYTRSIQDRQPGLDRFQDEMQETVRPFLNLDHFDTEFQVLEGNITRQLLQYSEDHNIDLTIMGLKKHAAGAGVASHRFLRGAKGSVLFVTEDKPAALHHVVIATDFSEYSVSTIRQSLAFLREQPSLPRVHFVNVYDVPTDMAYRISRTENQFAAIIRENVESIVPDFLAKFDLTGISHEFHLVENTAYNTAQHLMEQCRKHNADLLVIGASGHSYVSALLLGSVAERVLRYNKDFPLLIMRPS